MKKNKKIKYVTLIFFFALLIVAFYLDFSKNKYFSSKGNEFFPNETIEKKDFNLKIQIIKINPNLGNALLKFELVTKNQKIKKNYKLLLSSGKLEKDNENINLNLESAFRSKKISLEIIDSIGEIYRSKLINIKIDKNKFSFPFDSYDVNLNIDLLKNNIGIVYPKFMVLIEENILLNETPTKVKFENTNEINELSCKIHFKRPYYLQISFVLILAIILKIMVFSIKYLKSDDDLNNYEVLGLAATIFISIPSLRSFLIPSNLEYAPFFDIFSIVVLIAFLAIISFIINRNKNKTK